MTSEFIFSPEFEAQWKKLGLNDNDQRDLEAFRYENPEAGDVIQGVITGANLQEITGVKRRTVTISPLPNYTAETIRTIRNTLNLSQIVFAKAVGVSAKTIEAWESGRNKPQGPALRMLQILETDTRVLEEHDIICV